MSIRARDKTPAREEIEQKLVSERDFLKQLLLQVGERLEEVEKQITLVVRSRARYLKHKHWKESSEIKAGSSAHPVCRWDDDSRTCQGQCGEYGTTCAKVMGPTPNFPEGAPRDGQLHCDCQR